MFSPVSFFLHLTLSFSHSFNFDTPLIAYWAKGSPLKLDTGVYTPAQSFFFFSLGTFFFSIKLQVSPVYTLFELLIMMSLLFSLMYK